MSANKNPIKHTSQAMDNWSFDETHSQNTVLGLESDGENLVKKQSTVVAKKITVDGDNTYVAAAPLATAQSAAAWQAKKIAVSGGDTVITWADGDSSYDNRADDLTSLSYS